jgi:hypothetical protein
MKTDQEKIDILVRDGLIDNEDASIVKKILGDETIGVSLLELTNLKRKSETKWFKAFDEDNLSKMNFLDGFITLLKSAIDNWGNEKENIIM